MNSVHPLSFVAVAPDIIILMMSLALQENHFATHLSDPFNAATSTPALSYVLLLVSPQCAHGKAEGGVSS